MRLPHIFRHGSEELLHSICVEAVVSNVQARCLLETETSFRLRAGWATSEVAELKGSKVAISLYDSVVRCRPYSHGEVQTVANICTEEECRTVVMGVMTDVRQHVADLTDTTTSLLRERDAIISRLENELQEKVNCLADLAAKHATSPQDLDVVHREAKPRVSTVHSGGSMPPRVIACEMATLEQLRERHRAQRMALKQQRREDVFRGMPTTCRASGNNHAWNQVVMMFTNSSDIVEFP